MVNAHKNKQYKLFTKKYGILYANTQWFISAVFDNDYTFICQTRIIYPRPEKLLDEHDLNSVRAPFKHKHMALWGFKTKKDIDKFKSIYSPDVKLLGNPTEEQIRELIK